MAVAGVGYAGAILLALIFGVAGATKSLHPGETAQHFAALGLPRPDQLSGIVPAAELGVAALLAGLPPAGGIVALVLLAGFSFVIARAVARGLDVPCACFGSAWTTPVSVVDLARNGLLAVLAVGAIMADPERMGLDEAALVLAGAGVGWLLLMALRQAQRPDR